MINLFICVNIINDTLNVYDKSDNFITKWSNGLKENLHHIYTVSTKQVLPTSICSRLGYTRLNTVFKKLHPPVWTIGWDSKGAKTKGEDIEMYSTGIEKYDMRPIQQKGLLLFKHAPKRDSNVFTKLDRLQYVWNQPSLEPKHQKPSQYPNQSNGYHLILKTNQSRTH